MVSKGIVSVYLVPVRQMTTQCMATQDRQGEHGQVQVRRGDDRHTRGRRVPGTRPVAAQRSELKEWKEALGGRAKRKEVEEEVDLIGIFFYRIYEFLYSFSNASPVNHTPSFLVRYVINFIRPSSVISRSVSPASQYRSGLSCSYSRFFKMLTTSYD